MKPPPARSRTRASLIGVSLKRKSSTSLASGSLATVSWCLIERACFSEISAFKRSPRSQACADCVHLSASAAVHACERCLWAFRMRGKALRQGRDEERTFFVPNKELGRAKDITAMARRGKDFDDLMSELAGISGKTPLEPSAVMSFCFATWQIKRLRSSPTSVVFVTFLPCFITLTKHALRDLNQRAVSTGNRP